MKGFGTKYSRFYYPENLDTLDHNSIIYCVGAGEDISHDIQIAHQLNSDVYIFDPTYRAIQHVNYIKNLFNNKESIKHNARYGGGDNNYLNLLLNYKINFNKIKFYDYGLYTNNCIMKFYKPSNEEYVSHSVVEGMKGDNYTFAYLKTLPMIMKNLGHTKIDLLKIDIEGCECDVIKDMIKNNIYPTYLAVDFDLGWTGEKIRNQQKCFDTIQLLLNNNYKILHHEGPEYSFMLKI